ncbi:hypothetical protein SI65_07827 [Aspergillus cristatus]|uniref:Uncharacterized protein n=1 Tax=Aspergillus cristatus TaxID=573508 RepID=A0A1E3B7C2_ASPCR|nr:hypothetical protein SI65_07827 [Aspergillus cristatus]
MSGRDAQYAGEASYGSAPPGFVYQPNGYKSPQEQPRQPYNQNQNSAYYNHYNAPPEPPRQRDPPPRPRDDRYDYYDLRESYQNRGWGNNRNYYEPPRDPGYYPRAYTLDRRTEGRFGRPMIRTTVIITMTTTIMTMITMRVFLKKFSVMATTTIHIMIIIMDITDTIVHC